ncbi:MAG: hypothetical protein GY884_21140 [Proteobacteria bacterium]|nr:hypothetical protein [Pseudomonadota bacterium]
MILLALACAKETPGIDTSFQDADEDGVEWLDDCDDYDAEVGAPLTWYADTDGDGFGNLATATDACEQPNAFVLDDTDCDDGNGAVNPAATEVCNGFDDDCDGALDGDDDDVDLSTGRAYYADADSDGYGDPEDSVESCSIPNGYTPDDSDCDDAEAAINPDAPDLCNEVDDDCDGAVDDCNGESDEASATDATTSTPATRRRCRPLASGLRCSSSASEPSGLSQHHTGSTLKAPIRRCPMTTAATTGLDLRLGLSD